MIFGKRSQPRAPGPAGDAAPIEVSGESALALRAARETVPWLPRPGPRLVDVIDRLHTGEEVFFHYLRQVQDLMTVKVEFLTLDDGIHQAFELLARHGFRHVPILEPLGNYGDRSLANHALVGIVSQRDLVRVVSHGYGTVLESDDDQSAVQQPLSNIATRNPRTIAATSSLFDAVSIMLEHKIDCLPVVAEPESEQLVGILTTTDVIRCFVRLDSLRRSRSAKKAPARRLVDFVQGQGGQQPAEFLVEAFAGVAGDIMRTEVTTIGLDATVERSIALMQDHRCRQLCVIDAKGDLKGVLRDRDVLSFLPPVGRDFAREPETRFREALFRPQHGDRDTAQALATKVRVVMRGSPQTVAPDAPVIDVVELMIKHKIDAVPVIGSAAGRPTLSGVITSSDLLTVVLALGRLTSNG